jgi:hypothetical protein
VAAKPKSSTWLRSDYTVAVICVYAVLWITLAVYISGFSRDRADAIGVDVTTATLLVAVVLHVVASTATSFASSVGSLLGVAFLAFPTALLVLHRPTRPEVYFAYLMAHATIAAYVVDVHTSDEKNNSTIPRWLASAQVAYLVILLLDSLGRALPRTLYPAADVKLIAALHRFADIRLLLLLPIVITWVIIAIVRSRAQGSFDAVPDVWMTTIAVPSALAQVPVRFPAAVGAVIAIVAQRIYDDFLRGFRSQAKYLLQYLLTAVAAGTLLLGARAFAPKLVEYLRTSTAPTTLIDPARAPFVAGTVLVGFLLFLILPLGTAALAKMWRTDMTGQRTLQRSYQIAVAAAVPCALTGWLVRLAAAWFDIPGFSTVGIVSWAVLALVAVMWLFRSKLAESAPAPETAIPPSAGAKVNWAGGLPIAIAGALVIAVLLLSDRRDGMFRTAFTNWFSPAPAELPAPAPKEIRAEVDTPLFDGNPAAGQRLERGRWRYYWIDVPPGTQGLNVTSSDAAGGELFATFGSKATGASTPCRVSGVGERMCEAEVPRPGRWWIALHAAAADVSPTVTARLTYSLQIRVPSPYTSITLTKGATPLSFTANGDTGVYTVTDLVAGTYGVTLTKPFCEFSPTTQTVSIPTTKTVDFTSSCPYLDLTSGVARVGETLPRNSARSYAITVPNQAKTLRVDVQGSSDVDLYTNFAEPPKGNRRVCAASGRARTEQCIHRNPAAGLWWIVVQGYPGPVTYTVTATVEAGSQAAQ